MEPYRVREISITQRGDAPSETKILREYERPSADKAEVIEQVRRFFEIELSSPKALQTVDFDAIVVVDPRGAEIARFSVADFWMREWKDVAEGVGDRGRAVGSAA
jgi:hypothetical protein